MIRGLPINTITCFALAFTCLDPALLCRCRPKTAFWGSYSPENKWFLRGKSGFAGSIMGNCLCQSRAKEEETQETQQQQVKESGVGKGSIKLKIVLTREELDVLLLKLKNNNGGKSLEEVLGEVEKVRSEKVTGWRPSLKSIMEDPEGPEMDC